jgi:hypothetical protein
MDLRQECAASQDAPLPVPQAFVVRIDFTQFSRTNAPSRFFRRPEHPGLSQTCQIAAETPNYSKMHCLIRSLCIASLSRLP